MKAYSIGREAGCDIVINDNTDVVSRRHAILTVSSTGKMTITDQSYNGTYVNGIRISQNVPVPVTRKDKISFAHIARLDWNQVPRTITIQQYVLMAVAALIVLAACVLGYSKCTGGNSDGNEVKPLVTDSVKPKTEEQIKQEVQDSIKAAQEKKDSVDKARRDSIAKVKKEKVQPKSDKKVKPAQKPAAQPKKEDKPKKFR